MFLDSRYIAVRSKVIINFIEISNCIEINTFIDIIYGGVMAELTVCKISKSLCMMTFLERKCVLTIQEGLNPSTPTF